jgi:hypothetical protein
MKRAPHGAKFQKIQVKRVDFLSAVLARLSDDVGTVLDLIDQRNEAAERKIGFWASIRMIMPIVEAVASAVGETPQEVLGQRLGIRIWRGTCFVTPSHMATIFRLASTEAKKSAGVSSSALDTLSETARYTSALDPSTRR